MIDIMFICQKHHPHDRKTLSAISDFQYECDLPSWSNVCLPTGTLLNVWKELMDGGKASSRKSLSYSCCVGQVVVVVCGMVIAVLVVVVVW